MALGSSFKHNGLARGSTGRWVETQWYCTGYLEQQQLDEGLAMGWRRWAVGQTGEWLDGVVEAGGIGRLYERLLSADWLRGYSNVEAMEPLSPPRAIAVSTIPKASRIQLQPA